MGHENNSASRLPQHVSMSRRAFLRGRRHVTVPIGFPGSGFKAAIGSGCLTRWGIECRVCGEFCAAVAIRFSPRLGKVAQPAVHIDGCTGCGDCVGSCPGAAIAMLPLHDCSERFPGDAA
jgi:ferredoxin